MVTVTLTSKMSFSSILSVKVSVKKIKGAAHKTLTLTERVNEASTNVTLTGKMGMQPILPIKKVKGAARLHYGDVVDRCEQTINANKQDEQLWFILDGTTATARTTSTAAATTRSSRSNELHSNTTK